MARSLRRGGAALAERWFALSEAGDHSGLNRAMQVSKARQEAARQAMRLSRDRYQSFVAVLVAGLKSPRARVRFGCAHALDQFGDDSTIPALAALLDDPVPRVRWMAMHALSCGHCGEKPALDPEIVATIEAASRADSSLRVRRHAAAALHSRDQGRREP